MTCSTSTTTKLVRGDFEGGANQTRRREPRIRCDRTIVIMPFGFRTGLQFQPVKLLDCSRHGIGVQVPAPFKPGEQFMVKAKLKDTVLLIYTVRHCSASEDGYRVGGEFSGIIGPADNRDPVQVLDALLEGETP